MRTLPFRCLPLALFGALVMGQACSMVPSLPGACPAVVGSDAAHPPSVIGGKAVAPLAWQNAGATDAPTQESALAGADAYLADAASNALPGRHYATGANGDYDVRRVPADYGFQVMARKREADGRLVTLRTLSASTSQGVHADLNVATTILTVALLQGRTGVVGNFDANNFKRAVALVYTHLANAGAINPADEVAMVSLFNGWLGSDAELKSLFDSLSHDLATPHGNYSELLAALARYNSEETPVGLPPLPSPSAAAIASPASGAAAPTATPDLSVPAGTEASASPPADPFAVPPSAAPSASADLQGIVTTFVGGNGTGDVDGSADVAHVNNLRGLAVDDAGTLYVTEGAGRRIRKITSDGTVSTLAGTGDAGVTNGPGAGARFGTLAGITVGPDGALFVADSSNQLIRKIKADGTVSTFAGDGGKGHADGVGTAARFDNPTHLVYDKVSGNLFVGDYNGHDIRQITPDGTVSTIAGTYGQAGFNDGDGVQALFYQPAQMAIDTTHKLYLADSVNNLIRRIDLSGGTLPVMTVAGTPPAVGPSTGAVPAGGYFEGKGTTAQFFRPTGMAYDPRGFLVVADASNNRIRKLLPDGTTSFVAGRAGSGDADGTRDTAQFNLPQSVAVGPGGVVYVIDGNGGTRIRKIL